VDSALALVIDDSPLIQEILRDQLEDAGFTVNTARDGVQALERVKAKRPDVVVCDLAMPRMGGLDTIRELKRFAPEIPIIVLTETHEPEPAVAAIKLGASAYVRKGDKALLSRIDDAMKQSQAAAAERRRAEALAATMRESVRNLVDLSPRAMMIHRHGVILHVNQAYRTAFGFASEEELVGRSVSSLVPLPEQERVATQLSDNLIGGVMTFQDFDGSEREIELFESEIVFQGEPAKLVILSDLTQVRRDQAKKMTMDRLTSVGMLAAGAAHEINNPLAYLFSSLQILEEDMVPPNDDCAAALRSMREGLDRIRTIAQDLKGLSRGTEQTTVVDLRKEIELAGRMASPSVKPRARLVLKLADVQPIFGNGNRLTQVFLNLLINAAQAMSAPSPENEIVVTLGEEGGRVVAAISDNGSGMSPQTLAKLFQPFFTTKPAGIGTGLGLHICKSIVEEHHGTIAVKSAPGQGTTFTLAFPPYVD
jgi:two-component system, NtrC family, sensor kinase